MKLISVLRELCVGVKLIFNRLYLMYIGLFPEKKLKYLRKLGCIVGDNTLFVGNFHGIGSEPYLVEIGSDCLISDNVCFHTHDGGCSVLNHLGYFIVPNDKISRIKVGNNVFIGSRSSIMMGCTIGNNCIIGANSVVACNIPDNSVCAGVPARVICSVEEYFQKNLAKGNFYPTANMESKAKQKYLMNSVPKL